MPNGTDVDLSWAYEAGAAARREAEADCGAGNGITRESGRIEVLLDTILSGGGIDRIEPAGVRESSVEPLEADAVESDPSGDSSAIDTEETHDEAKGRKGENDVNEANFDQTGVVSESADANQVTANSGDFSGLDKGKDGGQTGEDGGRRTEDGGKGEEGGGRVGPGCREGEDDGPGASDGIAERRGGDHGLEIGDQEGRAGEPESKIKDSPSRGLPVLRSRQEEKRVRRELSGREIRRRVEELILGRGTSGWRILGDVVTPRGLSSGDGVGERTRGP